jgi:hypothetical protein
MSWDSVLNVGICTMLLGAWTSNRLFAAGLALIGLTGIGYMVGIGRYIREMHLAARAAKLAFFRETVLRLTAVGRRRIVK